MPAVCERDEVVPGVGVWTPGIGQLECDASRLATVEHSVKRLNLHVHDESVLGEALALSQDTTRDIRIEYHNGATSNSLKWALENLRFPLTSLTVVGIKVNSYEVSLLYALYHPLAQCVMEIEGDGYTPPGVRQADGVIRGQDWWYRKTEDTATIMAAKLALVDPVATNLVVDCDGYFHPHWYPRVGYKSLKLMDVQGGATDLIRFVDGFQMERLHMQTRNPEMDRWGNALETRLKQRGIKFQLDIV